MRPVVRREGGSRLPDPPWLSPARLSPAPASREGLAGMPGDAGSQMGCREGSCQLRRWWWLCAPPIGAWACVWCVLHAIQAQRNHKINLTETLPSGKKQMGFLSFFLCFLKVYLKITGGPSLHLYGAELQRWRRDTNDAWCQKLWIIKALARFKETYVEGWSFLH